MEFFPFLLFFVLLSPQIAQGNEIICNGGFETLDCWDGLESVVASSSLQGLEGVYFGGFYSQATETLSQNALIPSNSLPTYLQFYLFAYLSAAGLGNSLTLKIDGNSVFSVTAINWTNFASWFRPVNLDISGYADGMNHTFTFIAFSADNSATHDYSQFFVDEISVIYRPTSLYQRDVYVSPMGDDVTADGTQAKPFATIQHAVWAVGNTFTVWVNPGTYTENVDTSGKGIKISGIGAVTIKNSMMTCNTPPVNATDYGGNLILENMEFIDGNFFAGGAVSIGSASVATVQNLKFTNNVANRGGAIYALTLSRLNSINCSYTNNTATWGGAISMQESSLLTSTNDVFIGNVGDHGAAINVYTGAEADISQAYFSESFGYLGIIGVPFGGYLQISDSKFSYNTGELIFANNTVLHINNSTFLGNSQANSDISFMDACISLLSCNMHVSNCTFDENVVQGASAIIHSTIENTGDANYTLIENTLFKGSSADANFAIIAIYSGDIDVIKSNFTDNSAQALQTVYSNVFVEGTSFANQNTPYSTIMGQQTTLIIENSQFHSLATALIILSQSTLRVSGCTFENLNSVLTTGTSLISVAIVENSQVRSVYSGVGFNLFSISIIISNVTFTGSQATLIATTQQVFLDVSNCTFTGNTAPINLFLIASATFSIRDSVFRSNLEVSNLIYLMATKYVISNITMIDHTQSTLFSFFENSQGVMKDCYFSICKSAVFASNSAANISTTTIEGLLEETTPALQILDSDVSINSCIYRNNLRALMLASGSIVAIVNSTISNNVISSTGMIASVQSFLQMNNSFVSNNEYSGGIIYNDADSVTDAYNSRFETNFCFTTGGVIQAFGVLQVSGCTFIGNTAVYDGPAINFYSPAKAIIENSVFKGNRGVDASAIALADGGIVYISGCRFEANGGDVYSGGTIVSHGATVVMDNTIMENTQSIRSYFASITLYGGSFTGYNVTLRNNIAFTGSILAFVTDVYISSSDFSGNLAAGGSVISALGSNIKFESCSFNGNTAGTLVFLGAVLNQNTGGVALLVNSNFTATNSVFSGNSAEFLGGVVHAVMSNTTFINSTFTNNAGGSAGGIYFSSTTDLPVFKNCNFINNTAVYGAVSATQPTRITATFPDVIYSDQPFPVSLAVVDELDQIAEAFLPLFYVNVSQNSTVVQSFEIGGKIGQVSFFLNVSGTVGAIFTLSVSINLFASDGSSLQFSTPTRFDFSLHSCVNGDVPSSENPNICVQCRAGTVAWDGACATCPEGAICPGKTAIYNSVGYWIPPHPAAHAGPPQVPALRHCDPQVCVYNACRIHNTGVLCGECEAGTSKMRIFCNECDGPDGAKIFFYALFCVLFALVLSFYPLPSVNSVSALMFFANTVSVLGQYNKDFAIIPLAQFNVDYWPLGCFAENLNFGGKFFIGTLIPLLFVLPLSLTNLARRILAKISRRFSSDDISSTFAQKILSNLITLYPPLGFFAFHIFSRVTVESTTYLSIDQTVKTSSSIYGAALAFAIIYTLLGLSLTLLCIIFANKPLLEPLTSQFKPKFKFWNAVNLLRVILITIIFACFPFSPQIRTIIVVLLSFGFLFLQIYLRPYESKTKHNLEVGLQILACICALIVNSTLIGKKVLAVGILLTLLGFGGFVVCFVVIVVIPRLFPYEKK